MRQPARIRIAVAGATGLLTARLRSLLRPSDRATGAATIDSAAQAQLAGHAVRRGTGDVVVSRRSDLAGRLHEVTSVSWLYVRYFSWLLWLCRVSLGSAAFGFYLFAAAPQVQDMFFEIKQTDADSMRYWAVFYVLLLFGWVLVVHQSAQWMIKYFDDWALPHRGIQQLMRVTVPSLLGSICLIGVLLGQLQALDNIHSVPDSVSNTNAAFSEVSLSRLSELHMLLLLQSTVVISSFYLFFRTYQSLIGRPDALFLLYGLLVILIAGLVWFGVAVLWQSKNPVQVLLESQELKAHWVITGRLSHVITNSTVLNYIFVFLPTIGLGIAFVWIGLLFTVIGYRPGPGYNVILSIILTAATIIFFCVNPVAISNGAVVPILGQVDRAMLMPLILGAWVPVLTLLAGLSHRLRAPLLLLVMVFIPILSASLLGDSYQVREIAVPAHSNKQQIDIYQAVQMWRHANDCAEPKTAGECPRPIIVAAAGGASRAAFFVVSALGMLMDSSPQFRDRLFAISSVSGSSVGAAMFAASLEVSRQRGGAPPCAATADQSAWFYPTAWLDRSQSSRGVAGPLSWKGCLQILLTGDFLSAVAISLVFTDPTSFACFGDRAAILEQAIEVQFDRTMSGDAGVGRTVWCKPGGRVANSRDEDAGGGRSLAAPFSSFAPSGSDWRPLLIFNSTSVETGRRILVSHLKSRYCVNPEGRAMACPPVNEAPRRAGDNADAILGRSLFVDSYDLYDLLRTDSLRSQSRQRPDTAKLPCGNAQTSCDVRLSSAAVLSARFPLVSPPGTLRDFEGDVVGRAVDGGYFENYGATTAYEVTAVLREQFQLNPLVLLITNDPDVPENLPCVSQSEARAPHAGESGAPLPQTGGALFLSDARGPIAGLYNTRVARGNLAAISLCGLATAGDGVGRQDKPVEVITPGALSASLALTSSADVARTAECNRPTSGSFVHLRVYPDRRSTADDLGYGDSKVVSMSWWLSKPIQQYLDYQLSVQNKCAGKKLQDDLVAPEASGQSIQK
jgi:hypothetical protein